MVNRIYIVAHNYAQYRQWCWDNGHNPKDTDVYYVRDYTSLYGLGYNAFKIVYLEGWTARKDAAQIRLTIEALKRANGSKRGKIMTDDGMFSGRFWKLTIERMVRAFAGSMVGMMTMDGFNLLQASWGGILAAAGTASLVTLLLSVVGSQIGNGENPSLVE